MFGADHIGYIPRMLAAVAAFAGGTLELDAKGKPKHWHTSGGTADLDIKVVQLVNRDRAQLGRLEPAERKVPPWISYLFGGAFFSLLVAKLWGSNLAGS